MVGGLLGVPPTLGSVADSMLFFAFPILPNCSCTMCGGERSRLTVGRTKSPDWLQSLTGELQNDQRSHSRIFNFVDRTCIASGIRCGSLQLPRISIWNETARGSETLKYELV